MEGVAKWNDVRKREKTRIAQAHQLPLSCSAFY